MSEKRWHEMRCEKYILLKTRKCDLAHTGKLFMSCVFWDVHAALTQDNCPALSFFLLMPPLFSVIEHQNYFGIDENLGPVAVSIRREKVEDAKEKEGSQFNYRVAFRTSEVTGCLRFLPCLNVEATLHTVISACLTQDLRCIFIILIITAFNIESSGAVFYFKWII